MSISVALWVSCCSASSSGTTAASSSIWEAVSTCSTASSGGIAAVVWIRYGYPLVAKLMANLKKHILPWMTVVLTVFMAVNMGLSALALARYDARTSGIAPANQLDVFLDRTF